MLRIKKPTMIALMMFNFVVWFSLAFVTLDAFPILLCILSASILAFEVSSNGK